MNVFDRYAPFVQDFIYRNHWDSLRAVQVAAGDAIFNSDENVLISASTAAGKTEAAFFPILTLFAESPPTSVGAIYIGPLKALINDQFLRLNDLCTEAEIPVWHWHGDVAQSHKNKLLKNPSGISAQTSPAGSMPKRVSAASSFMPPRPTKGCSSPVRTTVSVSATS